MSAGRTISRGCRIESPPPLIIPPAALGTMPPFSKNPPIMGIIFRILLPPDVDAALVIAAEWASVALVSVVTAVE